MSDFTFKLNTQEVGRLLKSPEARSMCEQEARKQGVEDVQSWIGFDRAHATPRREAHK